MENNVETVSIDNYEDLLKNFECFEGCEYNKLHGKFIYRGEASKNYQLLPRILREDEKNKWRGKLLSSEIEDYPHRNQAEIEFILLKKFHEYANKQGLLVPPFEDYGDQNNQIYQTWLGDKYTEIASLAQHYGTPTRLLDWSFSYKVALYFAASNALNLQQRNHKDASDKIILWALNREFFESLNKKIIEFIVPPYANNDNVCAQKGILSYLKTQEQEIDILKNNKYIPLDEIIRKLDVDNNVNTLAGKDLSKEILLYKFEIPAAQCLNIMDYLRKHDVTAASLFPGFSGVTKAIYEENGIFK